MTGNHPNTNQSIQNQRKRIADDIKEIQGLNFSSVDLEYLEFAEVKKKYYDRGEIQNFISKIQADYDIQENTIYKIRNEYIQTESEKQTIITENNQLSQHLKEIIESNTEMSKKYNELLTTNERLTQQIVKQSRESSETKKNHQSNQKLQNKIEIISKENNDLKSKYNELIESYIDIEKILQESIQNNDFLMNESQKFTHKNEILEKQNQDATKIIKQLNDRIRLLTASSSH